MNIYIFFVIVQLILFIAKLVIQLVICKDESMKVSFYDILFGRYFSLSLFLPIKCRNNKIKCRICKTGNILLLLFYFNFILLFLYFTFFSPPPPSYPYNNNESIPS